MSGPDGRGTMASTMGSPRPRFWLLMAVAAVLAVAGPASAATVRLDVQSVGGQGVARVVYDAAAGERNYVQVSDTAPAGAPSDPVGEYWLQDSGAAMTPGSGCALTVLGDYEPVFIRCPIPAGARPGGAVVYLRDRDDVAIIEIVGGETQVFAGSGDDQLVGRGALTGGPGGDTLQGSGELQGGSGSRAVRSAQLAAKKRPRGFDPPG